MSNEITVVKSFFETIQVHLSDIWLDSCINWCKSENLPPNYTVKELQSKVYEQWLLLDLRDVEVPCLPPNLPSQKHLVLSGNFCLQMMQAIDISKPKLWQLQKIRNNNALTRGTQQEVDVVGTGKRMLQLTLTDGVQEVEAMEYRPIPHLSLNLPPGVKIRVMGPVTVRRGRLMLEQQNVKVLGGEVEELLVSNAAENVLARALKLPENPTPGAIEEKMLVVEEEVRGSEPKSVKLAVPQASSTVIAAPVKKTAPQCTISEEEELRIAREMDFLLEAERDMMTQPEVTTSKTPDLFENVDFNPDDFDEVIATSTQVQPKIQRNAAPMVLDDEDDDVFNDIDIDAHLNEIDKKVEPQPQPTLGSNTVPISKLLEKKNYISKGTFKIQARFKCVVEKLTVGDDEYKLVIKIEDDSGDMVVKVHSDIIADFTEYCPAAIMSLKNSILDKDTTATEKVMKAMQKLKDRLVKLDHVMVIQMIKEEVPVIIKIH